MVSALRRMESFRSGSVIWCGGFLGSGGIQSKKKTIKTIDKNKLDQRNRDQKIQGERPQSLGKGGYREARSGQAIRGVGIRD